jgi:uncharacterized membrane protein
MERWLHWILAAVWCLLIPAAFILLYTTLEIQAAARAAAGPDSKIASYLGSGLITTR